MTAPLLEVSDLCIEFATKDGAVRAADHLSFEVQRGEIVAIVGESGSGKSATSLGIVGLLPKPYGRITNGEARFEGRALNLLSAEELRRVRGNRIAMIFQDPMTSLNPYLTIGDQLNEVAILHLGLSPKDARKRAIELLDRVGIPDAARRFDAYPHELSGGMRQRVMIVMALLCDPKLLIADEPTTALDVTIQAQILQLLSELRLERQLSIILITHDLAIVAGTSDRVIVMYAGRIVETGPTSEIFRDPSHPYTRALLASVPSIDAKTTTRLHSIDGLPPRLDRGGFSACSFEPRCKYARDACRRGEPPLVEFAIGRARRCVVPLEEIR
jgi:oligopeptide/dipeptide ABC transporter ATP-binding protein